MGHLSHVVQLFPQLRSIDVSSGSDRFDYRYESRPDCNDEKVLPILQAAKLLRPSLKAVSFGLGVPWGLKDDDTWSRSDRWYRPDLD